MSFIEGGDIQKLLKLEDIFLAFRGRTRIEGCSLDNGLREKRASTSSEYCGLTEDEPSTGRLPHHCDFFLAASKQVDVVLNPFQCKYLIVESIIQNPVCFQC